MKSGGRCGNMRAGGILGRCAVVVLLGGLAAWLPGVALAVGTGSLDKVSGWYPAGSSLTVTATPGARSHFDGWSGDTSGATIAGNRITLSVSKPLSVTAAFAVDTYTLQVSSVRGTPKPAAGTFTYEVSSTAMCSVAGSPVVSGGTQYVCTGWTGTGDVPASGATTNIGAVTITQNSSVTWNWKTQYRLDTTAGAGGSVDVADSWRDSGDSVVITATNSAGYTFTSWSGDTTGCTINGNRITCPMSQARAITASFAVETYRLTVVSAHGTASPSGVTTHGRGASITATMAGSPVVNGTTQYVCTGWVGTGSIGNGAGTSASFSVTNETTITWQWQTNYWVEFNVVGR